MKFYLKKEFKTRSVARLVARLVTSALVIIACVSTSASLELDSVHLGTTSQEGDKVMRNPRVKRGVKPVFATSGVDPLKETVEEIQTTRQYETASARVEEADGSVSEESAATIRYDVTTWTTTTEVWKTLATTTLRRATESANQRKSQDQSWAFSTWVVLVTLMSVVIILLLVMLGVLSTACAVNNAGLRGIRHHLGGVGQEMNAIINDRAFWHLQSVAPERNASEFSSQRYRRGTNPRMYQASSRLDEITGGDIAMVPVHATISRMAGQRYQERARRVRESQNSFRSALSDQSEANQSEANQSEANMFDVELSEVTSV